MKWFRLSSLGLGVLGTILLAGCDAGGGGKSQSQTIDPIRIRTSPIFYNLNEGDENLCVGQEITLVGVNFSSTLEDNRVNFRFSDSRIAGLPVRVEFPTDGNVENGLESRLKVIVPTGIASGNVELEVKGVFAGAAGYFACPQIFTYAIGDQGRDYTLVHSGVLGFDPQSGPTQVILFGLNFEEVNQIMVSESNGNSQTAIPLGMVDTRPIPSTLPKNNLQAIGFDLDGTVLSLQGQRDNITVQLVTPDFHSNVIQVPVQNVNNYLAVDAIGPVVNGVIVPQGVRTGPVRIHYCMYDFPLLNQAFDMEIEWTVDDGDNWYPAWPDGTDSSMHGIFVSDMGIVKQLLPGPFLLDLDLDGTLDSPAGLFFGGGGIRTFSWDAQNDDNFRAINNAMLARGGSNPRNFVINFRIHPVPSAAVTEPKKPVDTGHSFISAPVAYYDLEDRSQVSYEEERRGSSIETFDSNTRMDSRTTARWGPPLNPGELRGEIPDEYTTQFGLGTLDLVLTKTDPAPLAELYQVDTSLMRIDHVIYEDDGTGNQVPNTFPVFPLVDQINPGEDDGEFHVRSIYVEAGVEVLLEGDRPAIFRVSGANLDEGQKAVEIAGTLRANGRDGMNGEEGQLDMLGPPVYGGEGVCGGGDGGNGALIDQGGLFIVTPAQDGGNGGGSGGETAAGEEPKIELPSSFKGAPGGGGGNCTPGGEGDTGLARNPGTFAVPHGGRGGPKRGSQFLVPLSPGSGGGGGGATVIKRVATRTEPTTFGGGGGGGGGAIQITANGDIAIVGLIEAKGGKGGNGDDSGCGGGGSGGCILLQATGFISSTGSNFDVSGGDHGVAATGQNRPEKPSASEGGDGWIRIESRYGGGPFSGSLAFQAKLTAKLLQTVRVTDKIQVDDVTGFPPRGRVIIDNEWISYRVRNGAKPGTLEQLSRAQRGTSVAEHQIGALVILDAPVYPPQSLVMDPVSNGSQFAIDPDPINAGLGADGLLHVSFIETFDPDTGEPLVDPETGNHISVWKLDTDAGMVFDPEGATVMTCATANSDPGLFALTRLKIDQNVTLRCQGSRPLRMLVTEIAEIAGTLDLSGFDGGLLQFDAVDLQKPSPGTGGLSGPGGGAGGDGGNFIFLDKNILNKDPSNTVPIAAKHGGLPSTFPDEYDRTGMTSGAVPPPDDLMGLETTRATPGDPIREDPDGNSDTDPTTGCGTLTNPCTAGGGGGGGSREAGTNGAARPTATSIAFGRGGSKLGLDTFRFGGGLFLVGGQGGAGGGACAFVSPQYKELQAGDAIFKGAARFAPGTGGGGGGGTLHLVVQGSLALRGTGAILARGGNAYQSIDWAGNGGAGAGGSILIQLANSLSVEPGARIDVSGGVANLPVPIASGQTDPIYENNIRKGSDFGGRGGDGAIGRVRIEVPAYSSLLSAAFNDRLYSGLILIEGVATIGMSTVQPLGVGPGSMAISHLLVPDVPILRFPEQAIPEGTNAFLLWEGGAPSLQKFGVTSSRGGMDPAFTMSGMVEDINDLQYLEYVRFQVQVISNGLTQQSPIIEEVGTTYRLGNPVSN
jgi:hypothetical protein